MSSHDDFWFDEVVLLAALGLVRTAAGGAAYPAVIIVAALGLNLLFPRAAILPRSSPWQRLRHALPAQTLVAAATIIAAHWLWERPWSEAWWALVWIAVTGAARLAGLRPARVLEWIRPSRDLPTRLAWPFRTGRWLARQLEAGGARAAAEAIGLGGAGWLALQLNPDLGPWSPSLRIAPWGWLGLAILRQIRPPPATARARMLDWAARGVIWAALLFAAARISGGSAPGRSLVAWVADTAAGLGCAAWACRKRDLPTLEYARLLLVGAFGLWLVHQRAFPEPLGGDAQWYALTMSDVIAQFRAGVFPIFVGQSEFQFNGSIFPIRIAPLYHHLGMAADLVTLRSLTPAELQNLVIVSLGMAGAATAYRGLVRLLPSRRWTAALLAVLYLGCPGVAAVLYGGDLYMTWTTVPLLPLVLTAQVQSYGPTKPWSLYALGFWLGLLWWGHSPIALWVTTFVGTAQAVRLWTQRSTRGSRRGAIGAAAVFGVIVLYPVISVLVVTPGAGGGLAAPVDVVQLVQRQVQFLHDTFPAVLLPVSVNGRQLSDYQLGWGLWILIGCIGLARFRPSPFWPLAVSWLVLLALLLPHPAAKFLWFHVPGPLRNPTGNWVATRLYLLAAGWSVWLAGVSFRGWPRTRRTQFALGAILAMAVAWTIHEDRRFVYGILNTSDQTGGNYRTLARENRTLTRYSYLGLGEPPVYFNHGVVEPELEQRILGEDGQTLLTGNLAALAAGRLPPGAETLSAGAIEVREREGPVWDWTAHFELQPGAHYALDVRFAHPEATGVLKISGRTVMRLYALPLYGGPASFGSAPGASPIVALSSEAPAPQTLDLAFIPNGTAVGEDFQNFGRYRWIRYDPAQLPIVVRRWIPYEAELKSPAAGWLETPRMFQPGYAATVNGQTAEVRRSPQGLVMAAVPGGRSEVVLAYHPPLTLLLSYWISFGGILAGLAWLLGAGRGRPDLPPAGA